jgi:hypothetical protein
MATFVATTASNGPRVTDPEAVNKVLERYFWDGELTVTCVKEEQTGHSHLEMYGFDWPSAWHIPEGIDPEEFEPDYADSSDGFDDFLKEIAPLLAEPLTVHAVGSENCRYPLSACEWHVRPGDRTVRVNSFVCPESEPQSDSPASAAGKPFLLVPCTIDWALLARQKVWLSGHATTSAEAAGLVDLLDAIQDAAVDCAAVPETVVFPEHVSELRG